MRKTFLALAASAVLIITNLATAAPPSNCLYCYKWNSKWNDNPLTVRTYSQPVSRADAILAASIIEDCSKIHSALSVGINYFQYADLLVALKIKIDPKLARLKDGNVRKDFDKAIDAYIDIRERWDWYRQAPAGIRIAATTEISRRLDEVADYLTALGSMMGRLR